MVCERACVCVPNWKLLLKEWVANWRHWLVTLAGRQRGCRICPAICGEPAASRGATRGGSSVPGTVMRHLSADPALCCSPYYLPEAPMPLKSKLLSPGPPAPCEIGLIGTNCVSPLPRSLYPLSSRLWGTCAACRLRATWAQRSGRLLRDCPRRVRILLGIAGTAWAATSRSSAPCLGTAAAFSTECCLNSQFPSHCSGRFDLYRLVLLRFLFFQR